MAGGWCEEAAYSKAERLTRRSNTDCWISREADESRLTTCRTALGCVMNLACTSAVKRNREHEEWRRHALIDSIRTIKEEVEKRSSRSGHDLLWVLHLAQGDRFAFLVLAVCGTPRVNIVPGYGDRRRLAYVLVGGKVEQRRQQRHEAIWFAGHQRFVPRVVITALYHPSESLEERVCG